MDMMDMVGKWSEIWDRFHGRGVYPHQLAFLLRLPIRDLVFSRRQLVRSLGLDPSAVVLEIGPGPGFFSPAVARELPRGRLELLDLQLPMLQKARRRVRRAGLLNVAFTCGSACGLPYRKNAFDVVFLVAVLGEVSTPQDCLQEIARVLRPGGRLVITELPGDPDALSLEKIQGLVTPLGFRQVDCTALRGGYSTTMELRTDAARREIGP